MILHVKHKKAFTLVELLTVVVIIGLIASVALVTLKDTTEVKAKEYTKKVIKAVKYGIAKKEEGRVFTGFMNDFGTMPPNIYFLLGIDSNETNFVNAKLGKYRITSDILYDNNSSDANISMPFLDTDSGTGVDFNDSRLNGLTSLNTPAMYIGYHGGYIGDGFDDDENSSIKDGWNKALKFTTELNVSKNDGDDFLTIISAGSDRIFQSSEPSLLKPEFDEYNTTTADGLKAFYSEDYTLIYKRQDFIPRNIHLDLQLDDNVTKTKVLIYSPMLYYVDDSSGQSCVENNTTHAFCDGANDLSYIPYMPYVSGPNNNYEDAVDSNLSWQIGVIKYEFAFDYDSSSGGLQNNGKLYVNNTYLKDINSSIDFGIEADNDFYISAGEKQIVILDYNFDDNAKWVARDSFSQIFMPSEPIKIKYPRD